ncbi:MAG: peptidase [Chloroflexi bacterium]|nr:peptidase [Chloroflexota bacterium]
MDRRSAPTTVASVLLALAMVGCGSSTTPAPLRTATAPPPPSATPAPTLTPVPSEQPTSTPQPGTFTPGSLAVTVSDDLVVRSRPEVSDTSKIYRPYLPTGTELRVIEGPVAASGYRWYRVEPVGFALNGGVTDGWVAAASRDGVAWIGSTGVELAMSTVARETAPASAAKKAAAAINAFGLDLYKRVDKKAGNVVVSPASIAIALAMARAGARGETAAQMDAVMRSLGTDKLASALNALDRALSSRNGTFEVMGGEAATKGEVILRQANSVFAQRDLPIEPAFLDALASRFGAGVRLADFKTEASRETARRLINAWVKRQTMDRIPELLLPPDLDDLTRAVLVNALYLKAPWRNPFDLADTAPGRFTRLDGSRVSVPMMKLTRCQMGGYCDLPYAAGSGWRAVELPFLGDQLAMTIIVPTNLPAFEKKLTPKVLAGIIGSLRTEPPGSENHEYGLVYDVQLTMPRFGVDTRYQLGHTLEAMGMPLAFDPATADFTGIATPPEGPLYIKKVVHQANIDVDEKGATASAATAIVMAAGGGPDTKPITFKVDRPFLFLLRDVPTGTILFLGRVTDPSKK